MDTADEIKKAGLDAKIFMLVHDSIVAVVKESDVEEYCRILKQCTQKDRGCSIPGFPVGVDQDIGDDYSFGDFLDRYALKDGALTLVADTVAEVNVAEILREEIEEIELTEEDEQ